MESCILIFNEVWSIPEQAKVTAMAKRVVMMSNQEMREIEICPNCYQNANTKKDWFIEVCPTPHLLVWAKLKGFPYWPAKARIFNSSGQVDVRFFGAHDRAWIPVSECYLYTEQDPNPYKSTRSDMQDCIDELKEHITKLVQVYGEFLYPPFKTLVDTKDLTKQLSLFLPTYKSEVKSPNPKQAESESDGSFIQSESGELDKSIEEDEMDTQAQASTNVNSSEKSKIYFINFVNYACQVCD